MADFSTKIVGKPRKNLATLVDKHLGDSFSASPPKFLKNISRPAVEKNYLRLKTRHNKVLCE
jgi:hypothetical protein